MKLILHLLFFYFFFPINIYSQCLVTNGIGSFESASPLTSWFTADEGNGSFEVQNNEVYGGQQSLKVEVLTDSNWKVRMFNRSECYFDIRQDEIYHISFYVKGNNGSNLTVTLMDNNTNLIHQDVSINSDDWTFHQVSLSATATSTSGKIKFNFNSAGTYYIDDIIVSPDTKNWYVSPSGLNNLNNNNGITPTTPLQSIQYAVNSAWEPGDTIFVMNGVYQNAGYGSGNLNNNAVVYLWGSQVKGEENGWLIIRNYPGHSPKIQFDGEGGFIGNQQAYLEISGFEIEGSNQNISYDEAIANRLIQDNYFGGRGIALWSGHHINIHHNKIYNCPNSGIRINNGDYCNVSYNEVYNNTWWSSNAESAIVFATTLDIDTKDTIKMVMSNNLVYNNFNNIPYYNSTYTGDDSDYGTVHQDYIIDGSGCYITRNRDTYFYGWFYFANNICYGNGINGLVVHKSDRAIVTNNTCFMNGAVPLSSGRQKASGITINGSDYVKMYNNISWPRNDDDYGYKVYDWANTEFLQASNNILAKGLSDYATNEYTLTDPLFVDTLNRDFRLQSLSPAIDNGLSHFDLPLYDYDSNSRQHDMPDVGAFEWLNPLSVEWINFEAVPIEHKSVLLTWKIMTELQTTHFIIERSKTGQDWEVVSNIKATKHSNYYTAYDNYPYQGLSYYRLKQVRIDGKESYSTVKSVLFNTTKKATVVVSPNPATHQLVVAGDKVELEKFYFYNILGQNMLHSIRIISRDLTQIMMDITNIPKGTYFLKTKSTTTKIIK